MTGKQEEDTGKCKLSLANIVRCDVITNKHIQVLKNEFISVVQYAV